MIPFLHLELSYVYSMQSLQDHWFVQVCYKQITKARDQMEMIILYINLEDKFHRKFFSDNK